MVEEYTDQSEESFYEQSLPVKGKHIISQTAGSFLGDVEDVYIDSQCKRMSAILFTKDLLGLGDKYFIAIDDVISIGEDVVIVKDKKCISKLTELTILPGKSISEFKGTKVTTLSGKNLGVVEDILLRPFTFRIGEIILQDGKRLAVNAVELTIGEDVVLVPEDYTSRIVIKSEQSESLLEKIVSTEQELVHTITDRSREVGRWVTTHLQ